MSSEAFVTLATNDGYALGALVLAESIRQVGTKRNLVVLISNQLSDLIRKTLERSFDEVIVVDQLNSNDIEHLKLLSRPELGITFTKINCWLLEQYSKCVFLDADCVVLRSIDDLFQREELSAASDAGWPDCFNSGVFVYRPSKQTFTKLMLFASQQNSSFDGGDQGLLNAFFSNWRTSDISRHLPFTYNVTANAFYSYLPAVTRFRNDIHVVHFAGALKPWQLSYNPQNEQLSGNLGGQSDIQRDFLLSWWRIMHQRVWPIITQFNQQSNSNTNSVGQQDLFANSSIGSLNYGTLTENKGIELGSVAHRRAWESGHVDYFGRDSFSNIQQILEKNIQSNAYEYHPSQQRQITPEKTTTQTTSILKNSNKQPSPPPPLQQTTNNQTQLKQTTHSTPLTTSTVQQQQQAPSKPQQQPTTSTVQQQQTKSVLQQQPTTSVLQQQQTTSVLQQQPTTSVLQQQPTTSTHQQQQTKSVLQQQQQAPSVLQQQPTTSVLQQQPTTSVLQQQPTKSLLQQQPTTSTSEKQQTTNVSDNLSKESTNGVKSVLKEATSSTLEQQARSSTFEKEQTTNGSDYLSKQSTNGVKSVLQEPTTTVHLTQNIIEKAPTTSVSVGSTNLGQILIKESTKPFEEARTVDVSENISHQPTTTNVLKSSTSSFQRENLQSLNDSNENKHSTNEHESNWTVKSTIVTAYTQGVGNFSGPTVVSKVESESSATTANDVPVKTTIKAISDSTNSSGLNVTAKTSNDHVTWLFDKLFVTITYAISLCYLLFLVAIRRSKNTNIIHENGSTVRTATLSSTTNNANRVNK